jgi:hypothetical protein
LLKISNQEAAKHFTNILLNGISAGPESKPKKERERKASANGYPRKK